MYPKFQDLLVRRVENFGVWPVDILERHPSISDFWVSQGLTSGQIDDILVAVTDGNWDLTSAYICGTGSAPSADERPHFLAEFLAQRHASYAEYSVYLTWGKILLKLDLI